MENKYADIFINAWHTVLRSFSSKQIVHTDVRPFKTFSDDRDILVYMGIVGDVSGQVAMAMDVRMGEILASEMLGGMEVTDQEELITSAVGEMCNMIMGTACMHISLANAGIVDITPPTVICNQTIPRPHISPSYKIALHLDTSDEIDFNVEIQSLDEKTVSI